MQDLKNHVRKRKTTFQLPKQKLGIQYGSKNIRVTHDKPSSYFSKRFTIKTTRKSKPLTPPSLAQFGNWIKIPIGLVVLFFFVWVCGGIMWKSFSFFQQPSDQIHLEGYFLLTPSEIYQISNIHLQTNFNTIDPFLVSQNLNQHPIIKAARVRKMFPNDWYINLQEQTPYVYLRDDQQYYLLDQHLSPIKLVSAPQTDHLILSGLDSNLINFGTPINSPLLNQGIQLLEHIRHSQDDWKMVTEIDISDVMNLKIKLQTPPLIVHMGYNNYAERLSNLKNIIPHLNQSKQQLHSVDLRYSNKAIVQF